MRRAGTTRVWRSAGTDEGGRRLCRGELSKGLPFPRSGRKIAAARRWFHHPRAVVAVMGQNEDASQAGRIPGDMIPSCESMGSAGEINAGRFLSEIFAGEEESRGNSDGLQGLLTQVSGNGWREDGCGLSAVPGKERPGELVSAAQFGYAGPWLKNIKTPSGGKFLCDHFACPFVIQQEEGKEVP